MKTTQVWTWNPSSRVLALSLSVVMVLISAEPARSATETVKVGTCTVTIETPGNTATEKADAKKLKDDLDNAVKKSAAAKSKIEDACKKHGNKLTIKLTRDNNKLTAAGTPEDKAGKPIGDVLFDPGDFDRMRNALVGKKADKDTFLKCVQLLAVLHEIEHNRDGTDPATGKKVCDHVDPTTGKKGDRGKQVDCENKVAKELGKKVVRKSYRVSTPIGSTIDWSVNGQLLALDVGSWLADLKKVKKKAPARVSGPARPPRLRDFLLELPDRPCGDVTPCWEPFIIDDRDGDGVPTEEDNCPDLANPQQGDTDLDGIGNGCDLDDNDNGWPDTIDIALGLSSTTLDAVPEHWAINTCGDDIDNDLDGTSDAADASCILPPSDIMVFLPPVAAGTVIADRNDEGGVPVDVHAVSIEVDITISPGSNGVAEETVSLSGPVVLELGEQAVDESNGLPIVVGEITAIYLTGMFGGAPIAMRLAEPAGVMLTDTNTNDGGNFPADVVTSWRVVLDGEGLASTAVHASDGVMFEGTVEAWPFFGGSLASVSDATSLVDDEGNEVATLENVSIDVGIPELIDTGPPDTVDLNQKPCCLTTGCTLATNSACLAAGGESVPGTSCAAPDPCEQGACCSGNGTCTATRRANCVSPATFMAGESCLPNPCSSSQAATIVQVSIDARSAGYLSILNGSVLGQSPFTLTITHPTGESDVVEFSGNEFEATTRMPTTTPGGAGYDFTLALADSNNMIEVQTVSVTIPEQLPLTAVISGPGSASLGQTATFIITAADGVPPYNATVTFEGGTGTATQIQAGSVSTTTFQVDVVVPETAVLGLRIATITVVDAADNMVQQDVSVLIGL